LPCRLPSGDLLDVANLFILCPLSGYFWCRGRCNCHIHPTLIHTVQHRLRQISFEGYQSMLDKDTTGQSDEERLI
jgi:hypothetical protein